MKKVLLDKLKKKKQTKKKKTKHTGVVSKDRNTETLFEHPRMKFGKLKPCRN